MMMSAEPGSPEFDLMLKDGGLPAAPRPPPPAAAAARAPPGPSDAARAAAVAAWQRRGFRGQTFRALEIFGGKGDISFELKKSG
jgi:hypothetical protein